MVVLDTTIVNVALPHIQDSLGFSTGGLSWVINAYILTFGGFLLLGARAGDLFGRRRVFLAGIALFTVSSMLGGIATSAWMLLAARALQGLGAALAAPSALSLLTVSFPEGPARVRAIGLFTTVSAAGGAIGLIAGGLLTQLVSWRWVMFVNVPIGIAVFLVGRLVLAETERRRGHFDLFGAMSCTVGIGAIVFGLVEAGQDGWASPVTVISFVLGAALVGSFLWHESRAAEPILPLKLLASRTRSAANAARGLLYAGFYGLFYFLAQFLQDVHGYSPLRAGLAFLPMPIAVFLASQFTTRVLAHRLPEKLIMVIGSISATVGLILATEIGQDHLLPPDRGLAAPDRSGERHGAGRPHVGLAGRRRARRRRCRLGAGQRLAADRCRRRPGRPGDGVQRLPRTRGSSRRWQRSTRPRWSTPST